VVNPARPKANVTGFTNFYEYAIGGKWLSLLKGDRTVGQAGSGGAVIVLSDPFTHDHAGLIGSLATSSGLPGIYAFARFAHNGGLVAYGIDLDEQLPKAGDYVARILKGAKAGDLPIQAPTRFRMTINLKAAKTLNLQIPSTLLALADEVIE
jgi:putative tryptophan/tyrosine transport system substrate-binding protein